MHVDPNATYDGGSAPDRADGAVYNTLSDAISKAIANDIIVIDDDMTINDAVTINKSIVLDLGGNTLTISSTVTEKGALQFTAGESQLKNGQIIDERSYNNNTHSWQTVYVEDATLTTADVTIQSYKPNTEAGYNYPIRVRACLLYTSQQKGEQAS